MQQWEYCRLFVVGMTKHKEKGFSGNLSIAYLDSNDEKIEQLAEVDKQFFSFNPFERVFGLLGSAGWELVSVHYGLINSLNSGIQIGYNLNTGQAIAFFKRPTESGITVDEPRIII